MNTEGGLSNKAGPGEGFPQSKQGKGRRVLGRPVVMPPSQKEERVVGHGPEDQAVEGLLRNHARSHFRRAFDGNRIGWALWKCRL